MFPLYTPFGMLISGPSGAGKTTLVEKMIKFRDTMFSPPVKRIEWFYTEWQDGYNSLRDIVVFKQGIPNIEEYSARVPTLIILDDYLNMTNGEIGPFFTKGVHHRHVSVILLVQNLFAKSKDSRDISLNASYILLLKSPRDTLQPQILFRQLKGAGSKYILEAYHDATREAHSYLLIDLRQNCPDNYRYRTRIFPGETEFVYIPKK